MTTKTTKKQQQQRCENGSKWSENGPKSGNENFEKICIFTRFLRSYVIVELSAPPPDDLKKQEKIKCVSNDRSHHDDQFCPKIVKIRIILEG